MRTFHSIRLSGSSVACHILEQSMMRFVLLAALAPAPLAAQQSTQFPTSAALGPRNGYTPKTSRADTLRGSVNPKRVE
jgi:hypothetical protein